MLPVEFHTPPRDTINSPLYFLRTEDRSTIAACLESRTTVGLSRWLKCVLRLSVRLLLRLPEESSSVDTSAVPNHSREMYDDMHINGAQYARTGLQTHEEQLHRYS
jgi:hypothetical protein